MRVLIAAGGTAGHINPALAIAGALKAADPAAEIHFAGRKEGMEYGLVTKAGYPFHHIEINGFQRKPTLKNVGRNVVALYHLALSGPRTAAILKEVRPDLVIGCGGYVSGPVVRAAAKKGIKTVCITLAVGCVLLNAAGLVVNRYINFPLYAQFLSMTAAEAFAVLWWYIVLFNLVKGIAVSLVTVLLYKRISRLFNKF